MLTIGKAAARAGLSPSAIRYYEARGLLRSDRLRNGYRAYDEEAIAALRFIRKAQRFGITLAEVRQLLEIARRGQQPCGRVRELARHHLREVEAKLRELRLLRQQLQGVLDCRITAPGPGEVCPLIERTEFKA